jgi:tetratricopeptide (TPR) repeat protein
MIFLKSRKHSVVLAFWLLVSVTSASHICVAQTLAPAMSREDQAHLMRGLDFASRKYPEKAAAEFKKCNHLTSGNVQQLKIIAKTFYDAGEVSASLEVIDYALSQKSTNQVKNNATWFLDMRGTVLDYLNRQDEAISSYKQAAVLSPGESDNFLGKAGGLLMKTKRYREALPLLERCIKNGAMNGFAYQNIGNCYLELNTPAKAIAPLTASINAFQAFRKRVPEAYMPGLIQSHKYLIKAYERTSNQSEKLVWQKRLDALIMDINDEFFGVH